MNRNPQKFLLVVILSHALNACAPSQPPTTITELVPATEVKGTPPPTLEPPGQTILVVSNDDSGPGTLRQALSQARSGDTIAFDPAAFPPTNPVAIFVASSLPAIAEGNLTIDASNAGVILDGSNILPETEADGLGIDSDGNTIRGLQILNFPGRGIGLYGSDHNTIGGDRRFGNGPLGQGNLMSRNGNVGIGLADASFNVISGNYIGTDPKGRDAWGNLYNGIYVDGGSQNRLADNLISDNGGPGVGFHGSNNNIVTNNRIGTDASGETPLGNHYGISVDNASSFNTIGPGNIVAHNHENGIEVFGSGSVGNTITQSPIYDNDWNGIDLWGGGNADLDPPIILAFDVIGGTVTGLARPNAQVEIFSTSTDEGELYEGQTNADSSGNFTFSEGTPFTGPHLIATATDADVGTSEFSLPTAKDAGSLILQEGNTLPITAITRTQSASLTDNRIGSHWHSLWADHPPLPWLLQETLYLGVGRFRAFINEGDWDKVDWTKDEFSIDPIHDEFVTRLAHNGLVITYNLIFWDKATYPGGIGAPCPRFKTEEEIERYLEFVRFIVGHFKDRIHAYEIWNEPDNTYCPQYIEPQDYVNLVRRAAPVIREEDPEARIAVGAISPLNNPQAKDYLFTILSSDIMPLVDVISWHPLYEHSPEYEPEYYYGYPSLVADIMQTAFDHGFTGEFEADEMNWRPHSEPYEPVTYSDIVAAKYFAREDTRHLGIGVIAGNLRIPHQWLASSAVVRNLSNLMAGAKPASLAFTVQGGGTNTVSYAFSLPDDGYMVALWTDGAAVEHDPGIEATLTIPGLAGTTVIAVDVLYGLEQQAITADEDGNLVISGLLIKDYPIFIRLTD